MNRKKTAGKEVLSFALQQKFRVSAVDADSILDTVFDVIKEELVKGNSVSLLNIGSMRIVAREQGMVRQAFGKEVVCNKSVNIRFRTSLAFVEHFDKQKHTLVQKSVELQKFRAGLVK